MEPVTLALDLGTEMGWALLRADGRVESGHEDFTPKRNEGPGSKFLKFRRWLSDTYAAQPFTRVGFEQVMFLMQGHSSSAAQVYGGYLACLQMFAETHQVEIKGFAVMTVKHRFAGSGKARKEDVMAQCRTMGFRPYTFDEADAIAVLHVLTERCALLTMSGATPKGPRKPKPQPEIAPGATPF